MRYTFIASLLIITSLFFVSCEEPEEKFDASGSFEAIETIISSESSGVLLAFNIEEGQELKADQPIGLVDTSRLYLQKKQLLAQIRTIGSKAPNIPKQTDFFDKQLDLTKTQLGNLQKEQIRFQKLVAGNAVPRKQLDDINAKILEVEKQLEVIKQQKSAQVSALSTQKNNLRDQPLPIYAQIDQINDQLKKCRIINPINGTVLTKYAEQSEMTVQGKPLYKIADLSSIILKAYISGSQLPTVKLNQTVKVLTDDGEGGFKETTGEIIWISNKSEFTPKTIQTKDERANLVYAIKIKVKNDGTYKIGMYGEVNF